MGTFHLMVTHVPQAMVKKRQQRFVKFFQSQIFFKLNSKNIFKSNLLLSYIFLQLMSLIKYEKLMRLPGEKNKEQKKIMRLPGVEPGAREHVQALSTPTEVVH
ncbi:hypothetical protein ACJX0J_040491 [Zea mays]